MNRHFQLGFILLSQFLSYKWMSGERRYIFFFKPHALKTHPYALVRGQICQIFLIIPVLRFVVGILYLVSVDDAEHSKELNAITPFYFVSALRSACLFISLTVCLCLSTSYLCTVCLFFSLSRAR